MSSFFGTTLPREHKLLLHLPRLPLVNQGSNKCLQGNLQRLLDWFLSVSSHQNNGITALWSQHSKWKSARRRHKHCALAVVRRSQKFSPRRRPLPGAQDGQNLISWRRSLPLPTDPVWWGSMHAISSYHDNTQTHPPTQPATNKHRQDRLQYTAPQLARSVIMMH